MQRYCHFESLVASLHKQPESHRHGGSDSTTKQIHSYHASAVFADIDFNAPSMNLAHRVMRYKSSTQKKYFGVTSIKITTCNHDDERLALTVSQYCVLHHAPKSATQSTQHSRFRSCNWPRFVKDLVQPQDARQTTS